MDLPYSFADPHFCLFAYGWQVEFAAILCAGREDKNMAVVGEEDKIMAVVVGEEG